KRLQDPGQELKLKPNTFDCQTIISVTALYTKQQWFPPETSVLHDNEEPKWLDGGWKNYMLGYSY
nr:hypothetical protein [Tanacetum cinerariifolium]